MDHIVLKICNKKGDSVTLYERIEKVHENSVEVIGFLIERKNIRFEKGFYFADLEV